MAGAGFKTFVDGDVLSAADVNTYLMEQAVMVFADASARSTAITAPSEGMLSFLTGTNVFEYYDGAAWASFGAPTVKQIVTATTTTQAAIISTATFTDSNLTATITPTSASSKIMIFALLAWYGQDASDDEYGFSVRLMRDATAVLTYQKADDNGAWWVRGTGVTAMAANALLPIIYSDSPATTSAITYKFQGRPADSTNGSVYFQNQSTTSSIFLIEY